MRAGLIDEPYRLTPEKVAKGHEPIATINESCIVFNAAFFLLFALMIVALVPILLAGLARRRRAAT